MPGRLNVADIQGKSPDFRVELEDDTLLEIHGDLRLNNQSYAPIPGGPDNERPSNPTYGSLWMNTWTCLLYTSPSPRDQRGSRMPSSA